MTLLHKLPTLIFILTTFLSTESHAQTKDLATAENRLSALYTRLFESLQGSWDTTRTYASQFNKQFYSLVKSNPETLNYPFSKLLATSDIHIKTSADGNFRIYSWDNWTGGTMHEFSTIYQWRDSGKVFTKLINPERDDPGSFISNLFAVDIDGKTFYLAVTDAIYSTKNSRQSVAVYSIDDKKLVDTTKLFKTRTQRLSRIDVDYDFFSVVDRPERPIKLISYDDKLKILYIPTVADNGKVTSKNILYQLKNDRFEYIGIEPGKR